MTSLLKGFRWNITTQVIIAVSSLVAVPVAIHRLGLAAYGAFTLAMTGVNLLQQLDGGMMSAALRYMGLAAGREDRHRAAMLLTTLLLVVAAIGSAFGVAVFLAAPELVRAFGITHALRGSAEFAARVVGVMLPLGLFQGVLSAALQANGRYRTFGLNNMGWRLMYVAGLITLVHRHDGLRTMMWLVLIQQIGIVATLVPPALAQVDLRAARLLPLPEVREIIRYSSRVQLFTLTGLVNLQLDTLIVGAALPLRDVALYGTGATIASQIRAVPLNAAAPINTRLAYAYGREGGAAAFAEYIRLQRSWAVVSAGFVAVTGAASVFLIRAWLGDHFAIAGVICLILTFGNLLNLLTAPLTIYLQTIGRPDVEVRYGLVSAFANLALTFGFLWLGVYAVAGATAVAAIIGTLLLFRLARRRVDRDIPGVLQSVPWILAAAAGAASFAISAVAAELVHFHGALGLLTVGASGALPGFVVFVLGTLGPRRSAMLIAEARKTRSLKSLRVVAGMGRAERPAESSLS
jgi:O-antigen/teichoic acid export membrane protein